MAATKKKDWSDLLGSNGSKPTAEAGQPKQPPVTVLMHTIIGNPSNPRSHEDYSDDDPEFRELKASMRQIGQLQPLAVVSRAVFEKAKPDVVEQAPRHLREQFQTAEWVVVTGNRRLAAARQLGWTRIDVRVQDRLGDEDGLIDEAVIIENIHRKNLAPIKEAEYLARMVERHGSQEKVAERIGKSQMFVSQRLALLNLAPDIQEEVNAGTLKIKEARQIARTPDHEEQRARVAEVKAKAGTPKPPRSKARPADSKPGFESAPSETGRTPGTTGSGQNPVLETRPEATESAREKVPEPRPSAAADQPPVKRFPYNDGLSAAEYLIHKMPPDEFGKMLSKLNTHWERQTANAN